MKTLIIYFDDAETEFEVEYSLQDIICINSRDEYTNIHFKDNTSATFTTKNISMYFK